MVYGTPNVVKQFVVYALWVFRDLITFFFGPLVACPLPCKTNSTAARGNMNQTGPFSYSSGSVITSLHFIKK